MRDITTHDGADSGRPERRIFAQTLAVNTPSRATLAAAGLTFARAFISADPYDDLVPGAEQGEVEYEITRSTWQQRHRRA